MESQMDAFLARVLPDTDEDFVGGTQEDVVSVQRLVSRQLPEFYQWYLLRMGRRAGSIGFLSGFSIDSVSTAYGESLMEPSDHLLLIGTIETDIALVCYYYDLRRQTRNDALVLKGDEMGGSLRPHYETFREMLASVVLAGKVILRFPYNCRGFFNGEGLSENLASELARSGFVSPIVTGEFCGTWERPGAAIQYRAPPTEPAEKFMTFSLGAASLSEVRKILGQLGSVEGVEVEISYWNALSLG